MIESRKVYGYGANSKGQLGIENGDAIYTSPILIPPSAFSNIPIVEISAGYEFSLVLTSNFQLENNINKVRNGRNIWIWQ
jgi:alpha-tubulin suppressor-like RCC1 family protein